MTAETIEDVETVERPAGEWPTGVAWDDLDQEWFDYFTSEAFDFPPTCCDLVVKPHHTTMTYGLCVACGMLIG